MKAIIDNQIIENVTTQKAAELRVYYPNVIFTDYTEEEINNFYKYPN